MNSQMTFLPMTLDLDIFMYKINREGLLLFRQTVNPKQEMIEWLMFA